MPIKIACQCGRAMQVGDEHAGKRGKCPSCGASLVIPADRQATTPGGTPPRGEGTALEGSAQPAVTPSGSGVEPSNIVGQPVGPQRQNSTQLRLMLLGALVMVGAAGYIYVRYARATSIAESVSSLSRGGLQNRVDAAKVLANIGRPSIPLLVKMMAKQDGEISRQWAVYALALMGSNASEAIPALQELAEAELKGRTSAIREQGRCAFVALKLVKGDATDKFLPAPMEPLVPWPRGTGYVRDPGSRPPFPVYASPGSTTTVATITGATGPKLHVKGSVETVFDGNSFRSLLIHPGATLTQGIKSKTKLNIIDFNGDECIVPYGMTVRVGRYGQFVPVRYAGASGDIH